MPGLASLSSIQEVMAKPLRQSVIISGEKPARPSYGESISQSTIIVLGDYANTGKIKVSEVLSGDPSWTNKTLTLRSPLVMGCRLQPVPSFKNGAFIYRPPQSKGGRWGITNEEYWEAFDLPDQISFVKYLVPIYKKQSEQQRLQALSELFIEQNIPKAGEFDGDPHSTFKKEFLWAITKMRKPENFEIVQKLYGRKDLSSTDKLSLQDWIGNTLDPRANSLLIEALNSKDRFVVSDAVTKLTSYYRNDKTDAALL
ncbi:MAG: hypothetical protein IAF58_03260, partial [Leptolyngbya sp.]|nr:hypothetical protein [Candidatus Melainabacteria bacterium]